MPLDTASPRRWYRPAHEPLPEEPGRLLVCALLARARVARGCVTPGDDRLETRAYAVKRYLFRLGHAARSARYATSIAQLVVGLAPVMGWGAVPRGRAERARFVRTHRRSVQRWLDDLEAAGLVAHEPERDEGGRWWRTQIVLLAAPSPSAGELAAAEHRARRWRSRERARRRRLRRSPSLGAIRARSGVPSAPTRARLAIGRRLLAHEARRRAQVEATIAACRDLTHPFGAPPPSAPSLVGSRRSRRPETPGAGAPTAQRPAPTASRYGTVADETGARGRAAAFEERLDVVRRAAAQRTALLTPQVDARVRAVAEWPAGRRCPLGRLREAWVAHRYGLAKAIDTGGAPAGAVSPDLTARVGRAVALYEAFAVHRPLGWPRGGAAALCVLASQQRATVLAGDVARLLVLAKGMRAAAQLDDARRVQRARARALARSAPSPAPLAFRIAARVETAEARRRRVRDAVLLLNRDPATWPNAELAIATLRIADLQLLDSDSCEELDGIGARATRYRNELKHDRWRRP